MSTTYLVFFDIDASYQVFKLLSESKYLTHSTLSLYTVDCVPREKCGGYIDKVVRAILPYGWERYVFMRFQIGRLFRKSDIIIVSGRLKPYRGILAFYPGYDYPVLSAKLEGKMEAFYRNLYYEFRKEIMDTLDELKENIEKRIDIVNDITRKFIDILKKYDEYLSRSVGILSKGSEALTLAEAGLIGLTTPPPPTPPAPPSPPPPPPKRGIIERIKSFFRRGRAE